MWQHNYEPVAGNLAASAAVAAIPIVVLFVMLGLLRRPAWMSAATALGSAMLVALLVYGMPPQLANLCCTPETVRMFLKDVGRGAGLNCDPSHLIRVWSSSASEAKEYGIIDEVLMLAEK